MSSSPPTRSTHSSVTSHSVFPNSSTRQDSVRDSTLYSSTATSITLAHPGHFQLDSQTNPIRGPFMLQDLEANCEHLATELAFDAEWGDTTNPPRLRRQSNGVLLIDHTFRDEERIRDSEDEDDAVTLAELDQPVMHTEEKAMLIEDEDNVTLVDMDEAAGGEYFHGQNLERKDMEGFWIRFLSRRDVEMEPSFTQTTPEAEDPRTTEVSKTRQLKRARLERLERSLKCKRLLKKKKRGRRTAPSGQPEPWDRFTCEPTIRGVD